MIQKNDLNRAESNLLLEGHLKRKELASVENGRLGRSQKILISNECNVLEIVADLARFGNDNFFNEKHEFEPLRWFHVKRMFAAATFLVQIVKKISECFK